MPKTSTKSAPRAAAKVNLAKQPKTAPRSAPPAKEARKPKAAPKPQADPDVITSSNAIASGADGIVVMAGKTSVVIKRAQLSKQLNQLAQVGGSLKAVKDYLATVKPQAQLARGIGGRDAPQSAAAVAAGRAANAASKGTSAAPKAAKARAATSGTRGKDRAYKATSKPDTSKPGSYRTYMISTIRAHGTEAAAKAAHAASGQFSKERLNFNWAAANGYITFA